MSGEQRLAFVLGLAWLALTFVGIFAWITHFGWPHSHGSASSGACAVTGGLWILLAVAFTVAAALRGGDAA